MASLHLFFSFVALSPFNALISGGTTTFTDGISMARFNGGFTYNAAAYAYNSGQFIVTLQDSPDNSVWTDVPPEKLNDPTGNGEISITGLPNVFDILGGIGAFSTATFVRLKIVSSSSPMAEITAILIRKPDNMPAQSL